MLRKLNWRSLAQRRANARLNLMYRIVYGLVNIDGSKYFKLQRDGIKIHPIYGRTKYYGSGISLEPSEFGIASPSTHYLLTHL